MAKTYSVEGYWDCHYCGAKGIRGRTRNCPNCGKPRGQEVKFYLKEFDEKYKVDNSSDKPDWFCEYCSSYNPDSADICISCSATRGSKTYSSFRDTGFSETIIDADGNKIDDFGEISDEERDALNYQTEREDRERARHKMKSSSNQESSFSNQNFKQSNPLFQSSFFSSGNESRFNLKRFSWKSILGVTAGIFLVIGLICWILPKEVEFEVNEISWNRSVNIEQRVTVKESGWTVPSGGRIYDTRTEIKEYQNKLDHYETYYETVSEKVIDHYKTVTKKRDKGNGDFEITEEQQPVCKTVQRKEKRERPVYVKVPIYETKYYYKLERWKFSRSVDTSGEDKNPYFGDFTLQEGKLPYNVGKERVSSKTEKYSIGGIVEGDQKSYSVDFSLWQDIEIGDKVKGKVSVTGHFEKST